MLKKVFLFFLLICFLFNFLFASLNLDPQYLSYDEKKLFLALKNGNLDKFSLIDFILIISGINSGTDDYKVYKNKFKNLEKDVLKHYKKIYKDSTNTDYEKASYLLNFIHDNYLRELVDNEYITIFDTLLIGKFNSLYSTILYVMLAQEINLKVEAVVVANYVFAVLHTDSGDVYIDTAVKSGFNVDKSAILKKVTKKIENVSDIINNKKDICFKISILELISLLYFKNFVSDNSNNEEISLYSSKGISNYMKSMFINPKSIFLRSLFSGYLVEYATNELKENRIEKAIELIYDSKKINKNNDYMYLKAIDIFNLKIDEYLKQSNFELANSSFQKYLQFFNGNEIQKNNYIDRLKRNSIKKIVYFLNNRENLSDIKKLCDFALNSGKSQDLDKRLEDFYVEINNFEKENKEKQVLKEIVSIFNNGDYETVITKTEELMNSKTITSSVILTEIVNYKNSSEKLILFSDLVSKYDKKDFRHITYKEIKKIENLNIITGNNISIKDKLLEIMRELTKFREQRNKRK